MVVSPTVYELYFYWCCHPCLVLLDKQWTWYTWLVLCRLAIYWELQLLHLSISTNIVYQFLKKFICFSNYLLIGSCMLVICFSVCMRDLKGKDNKWSSLYCLIHFSKRLDSFLLYLQPLTTLGQSMVICCT